MNSWDEHLQSSIVKHSFPISAISVDDCNIYTTAGDGQLIVLNKFDLSLAKTIQVCDSDLLCISLDDKFVYTGGIYSDGKLRIWDKEGMVLVTSLEDQASSILSLSSTNEFILAGISDGSFSIWRKPDWTQITRLKTEHEIVLSTAIDETYIYIGGIRNYTSVYTRSNHEHVTNLIGHDANVFSLAVDDRFVYSGSGEIWWGGPGSPRPPSFESAIRVWDKRNWECTAILSGHTDNVNALAVDNVSIYSVSDDGSLRIYDKSDWSEVAVIERGLGVIQALDIDKDFIYIAGADCKVTKISKSIILQAR